MVWGKSEDSRVHDLEKRLAEVLRDKADALEQLQTRDRELVEEEAVFDEFRQVGTADMGKGSIFAFTIPVRHGE